MTLRLFLVSIFFTGVCSTYGQSDTTRISNDLDSAFQLAQRVDPQTVSFLTTLLKESREQSFARGEAEAFFCLGEYYNLNNENSKSWPYFDSARVAFEALAADNSGNKKRWAQSLNMLGSLKMKVRQYRQSVPYFEKAAVINKAINRKQNLGDCYYNLATVHFELGEYVEALEYFFAVLKIDEEIGYKEGIADDYGHIGVVYEKIGDIPKAVDHHKKAVEIGEASGNKQTIMRVHTNYGLLMKNIGKFAEAHKMLQRALDIGRELKMSGLVSSGLHNMGALSYAEGNPREAIRLYNESLSYNSEYTLLTNYEGLAQAYLKLKDYATATAFAKRSLRLAEESKMMATRKNLNLLLADITSAQGNYKLSLDYYKQYSMLKDSLLDSDKTFQIQDIQAKYDTEKKEHEIVALTRDRELQDANIRQKTSVQYALIIGVIVLIAFGLVTFRIFRGRQEARRLLLAQQLKTELQETERVKELDKLKSRFFANIAHEFRTPLTLILGPVENLIHETTQTAAREQLVLVKNNTSRLVKLVNQLLDLSKLDAGVIKFDYVQEDIIPFLKSITFAFQSMADQKKISIQFNTGADSFITQFDRDKLEKIFSNLLSNAFKFTPEGGKVTVEVSVMDQRVRIQVTDSGPGIPAEDLPYIFNRFYQAGTSARNTTGSGIGLELTKELVEICGGSIRVLNVPSGGAQFDVTLPLISGQVTDAHANYPYTHTALELEEGRVITPGNHETTVPEGQDVVLVIEDNQDVRDYIERSLTPLYQVITASNGEEGIAKALETIPDLIITDVMMPLKDGLEVCRTLKEARETSHIPIIMLTAKADVESRIEGLQTGADDYLAKPFHTKELLTRIQNLIQIRATLQAKFRTEAPEPSSAPSAKELPPREKLFLDHLHEVITQHLAEEEYSVEELSRDMAMSRMQLHRKVKALTDTSAGLYIRFIRLTHGKRLLEEGIYNVSEVAYRVGFNSPTYFSTCFSEQFGFPPSEIKSVVIR